MISPLAQRQMFQTAHVEAVRQAHEVSGHLQREASQRKTMDEHLLEQLAGVQVIPEADALRTEERRERRRREERAPEPGHGEEEAPEEGAPRAEAGSAERHLDLLA